MNTHEHVFTSTCAVQCLLPSSHFIIMCHSEQEALFYVDPLNSIMRLA